MYFRQARFRILSGIVMIIAGIIMYLYIKNSVVLALVGFGFALTLMSIGNIKKSKTDNKNLSTKNNNKKK